MRNRTNWPNSVAGTECGGWTCSAATEVEFDPDHSDLDFLVEFDSIAAMGPADQYFGLREELGSLFGREIHLVSRSALRSPFFIKSVNATRQTLYGP